MTSLRIPVSEADHHDGPLDAPLVLVEYGDYECPYCGEAFEELKAVKAQFGDRLCFVFRNFPLTQIHPHALHAAELAEFAAQYGKFWQAHDLIYQNQSALRDADLVSYAGQLSIDIAHLPGSNDALIAKIQADFSGGVRSGVNGTPSIFINGTRYDGPNDRQSLIAELSRRLP